MTTKHHCGIYARISSDSDGRGLGVARQIEDCQREADRRGWEVVGQFVDNDVSASNGKKRPEYVRMIEAIEAGHIKAVVVWDIDRLTRTPSELETFIDLADRYSLDLASIGGEVDLSTVQGRLTARIKGSVARSEVEQQSRRLKRKYDELAAAGQPHGPVPYGYNRVDVLDDRGRRTGSQDVINEAEAVHVRDWFRRVANGETIRSIVKEINALGLKTRRGNDFINATLSHLLRKPLYVGLRVHRGEVVGPGNWEPLIDRDTYDRAQAILNDPSRIPPRGPEPIYLGSGIYKCGECGGPMRPVVQAKESKNRRAPAYSCADCQRVVRKMQPIDELVEAVVIGRLSQPHAGIELSGNPDGLREAITARDAILARLDNAADEYADGLITVRQLTRITERLKMDLDAANRKVSMQQPARSLHGMTGAGAADAWAAAPMIKKREILRELVTVTILKSGPGRKFEPEQVRFEWKGAS